MVARLRRRDTYLEEEVPLEEERGREERRTFREDL